LLVLVPLALKLAAPVATVTFPAAVAAALLGALARRMHRAPCANVTMTAPSAWSAV